MIATAERPFCLADFEPFLRTLTDSGIEGILIGGLAVAAWADSLLDDTQRPAFDLPIFSKDIDLRGGRATCIFLAKDLELAGAEVKGMVAATRRNAPEMGKVHAISLEWRGCRTSIEALERLPGLDHSIDSPLVGSAMLSERGFRILDPCSLFICKLHAANTRPSEAANNDVKHLCILAKVIPTFLRKVRASDLPDYDANADAQRLLDQIAACQSGAHLFQIPLVAVELDPLVAGLREHLAVGVRVKGT